MDAFTLKGTILAHRVPFSINTCYVEGTITRKKSRKEKAAIFKVKRVKFIKYFKKIYLSK